MTPYITDNQSTGLLLDDLSNRVFAYTFDQAQSVLDARLPNPPSADRLIRRLAKEGLVKFQATALTFVETLEPLWRWGPGQEDPNCGALQWQLHKRWRDARSRRVKICWATQKAARMFAGVAKYEGHATQVEHDLGTAAVLVRMHETCPHLVDQWIGEAVLKRDYSRKAWLKSVPDAVILERENVVKFIEFGGHYKAERIRRFHQHCRRHNLAYELW